MKRTLGLLCLTLGMGAFGLVSTAEASSYLSINVGGTVVTCDNSLAINAGNCGAGFVTVANGTAIAFSGTLNGVSFGQPPVVNGVQLTGNSPGGASNSFATDTKTTVNNISNATDAGIGGVLITISFAQNDFVLPAGAAVLKASQSGTSNSGDTVLNFTGYGDDDNLLTSFAGGAEATSAAPNCVLTGAADSCSLDGPSVVFAKSGTYSISGIESFRLNVGEQINASGTVNVNAIPEPASILLLGSGLTAAAARLRRRKKTA